MQADFRGVDRSTFLRNLPYETPAVHNLDLVREVEHLRVDIVTSVIIGLQEAAGQSPVANYAYNLTYPNRPYNTNFLELVQSAVDVATLFIVRYDEDINTAVTEAGNMANKLYRCTLLFTREHGLMNVTDPNEQASARRWLQEKGVGISRDIQDMKQNYGRYADEYNHRHRGGRGGNNYDRGGVSSVGGGYSTYGGGGSDRGRQDNYSNRGGYDNRDNYSNAPSRQYGNEGRYDKWGNEIVFSNNSGRPLMAGNDVVVKAPDGTACIADMHGRLMLILPGGRIGNFWQDNSQTYSNRPTASSSSVGSYNRYLAEEGRVTNSAPNTGHRESGYQETREPAPQADNRDWTKPKHTVHVSNTRINDQYQPRNSDRSVIDDLDFTPEVKKNSFESSLMEEVHIDPHGKTEYRGNDRYSASIQNSPLSTYNTKGYEDIFGNNQSKVDAGRKPQEVNDKMQAANVNSERDESFKQVKVLASGDRVIPGRFSHWGRTYQVEAPYSYAYYPESDILFHMCDKEGIVYELFQPLEKVPALEYLAMELNLELARKVQQDGIKSKIGRRIEEEFWNNAANVVPAEDIVLALADENNTKYDIDGDLKITVDLGVVHKNDLDNAIYNAEIDTINKGFVPDNIAFDQLVTKSFICAAETLKETTELLTKSLDYVKLQANLEKSRGKVSDVLWYHIHDLALASFNEFLAKNMSLGGQMILDDFVADFYPALESIKTNLGERVYSIILDKSSTHALALLEKVTISEVKDVNKITYFEVNIGQYNKVVNITLESSDLSFVLNEEVGAVTPARMPALYGFIDNVFANCDKIKTTASRPWNYQSVLIVTADRRILKLYRGAIHANYYLISK